MHCNQSTLLNNDYPLNFIFDTINERLKYHAMKNARNFFKEDVQNNDGRSRWFTVPYIPIISEKLKNAVKDLDINVIF